MPQVIETTVYKFSELSESAKQKAISDNYEMNVNYDWWDCTYEYDAGNIGLKLSGFDLGRGRSIDGKFAQSGIDTAESILKEHGDICDTYKYAATFKKDYLVLQVKYKLLNNEDTCEEESELEELEAEFLKDILNCYWKILDNEYDYLTSDECIGENLENNDCEFEEDGSRF